MKTSEILTTESLALEYGDGERIAKGEGSRRARGGREIVRASSTVSHSRPSVESAVPVSAIVRVPKRRRCSSNVSSSRDSPLFERRIATSSAPTSEAVCDMAAFAEE
jgi:hypothetical protein